MVVTNRLCSECGADMLLDRVTEKDGEKTYWYTCVNPRCKEKGKSYTATGKEEKSTIKDRE